MEINKTRDANWEKIKEKRLKLRWSNKSRGKQDFKNRQNRMNTGAKKKGEPPKEKKNFPLSQERGGRQ